MAELAKVRQSNKDLPIVDNAGAVEVFTDNLIGLSMTHGNVNITFATVRTDHNRQPATAVRAISSRLVMPLAVAAEMHQVLSQFLTEMQKQGIVQQAASAKKQ